MATFGYTTHGASQAGINSESLTKFTPSSSGTVSKITVYIKQYFGGGCNVRVAIYADNAGTPQSLLASSGSATAITASDAEYDVAISLAVTSGTPYWLATWADNANADIGFDAGAVHQNSAYGTGHTYPTWVDPWVENFAFNSQDSIYATYTESGGGTISVPAGSLVLAGKYVGIAFIDPGVGQLRYTGYAPTLGLTGGTTLAVPAGSLVHTGRTLSVAWNTVLSVGVLVLTGRTPSLMGVGSISPDDGLVQFTGYAVTVTGAGSISPTVGSCRYTGYALTLTGTSTIAVPVGSARFTGYVPSLTGPPNDARIVFRRAA